MLYQLRIPVAQVIYDDYMYTTCEHYLCIVNVCSGSFATDATIATLYEHNVYTVDRNQISVRAFQVRTYRVHVHVWQSQVESEHYSYKILTTFSLG